MVSDVTIGSALNQQQRTESATTKLAEDFSQFLRLLTVQLQNQDPLSPMDTTEFTNQLVAFTGVEQQINTNQKLDSMVALNLGTAYSQAQNYVGQEVSYISSEFDYTGKPAQIRYSLKGDAVLAKINVVNERGDIVYTTDALTSSGVHDFNWDGTTKEGGKAPIGTYQIRIDALDQDQEAVESTTVVRGLVRGTESQNGQIFLLVGERAVALSNILNTNLPSSSQASTDALTAALSYVGLNITYANSSLNFNGSDPAEVEYTLEGKADRSKIFVLDQFGRAIYTQDAAIEKGTHSFSWDGRLSDGSIAPAGQYEFIVDALTANDTQIKTSSTAKGLASGVESQGGKIYLNVDGKRVALDSILSADIPRSGA